MVVAIDSSAVKDEKHLFEHPDRARVGDTVKVRIEPGRQELDVEVTPRGIEED